jgi:hypothetical protein
VATAKIDQVFLNSVSISSTLTRSSFDLSIGVQVPAGKVTKDTFWIVQLNGYNMALFFKQNVGCTLTRDTETTGTNYAASSCDILWGNKIRIPLLTTDSTTTSSVAYYTLKFLGLPSPSDPTSHNMHPELYIMDSYTSYKATHRSVSTNHNYS